jgi:hypothetical protein
VKAPSPAASTASSTERARRRDRASRTTRALELELAIDYGLDTTSVIFLQDAPAEVRAIGIVELGDHDTTGDAGEGRRPSCAATRSRCSASRRERDAGVDAKWPAIGDPAGHAGRWRRPAVGDRLPAARVRDRPAAVAADEVGRAVDQRGEAAAARHAEAAPDLRREGDELAGTSATTPGRPTRPAAAGSARRRPLDDVHNHACRALAYWAVDRYPPIGRTHDQGGRRSTTSRRPRRAAQHRRRARDDVGPAAVRLERCSRAPTFP